MLGLTIAIAILVSAILITIPLWEVADAIRELKDAILLRMLKRDEARKIKQN